MDDDRGFFGSLFDFSFDSTISGTLIQILYGLCMFGGGIAALFIVLLSGRLRGSNPIVAFFVVLFLYFVFLIVVRFTLESMMTLGKIAENTRKSALLLEQLVQASPGVRTRQPQPTFFQAAEANPTRAMGSQQVAAPVVAQGQVGQDPALAPSPPSPDPATERLARRLFTTMRDANLQRTLREWVHGGDVVLLRRAASTHLAHGRVSDEERSLVEALLTALGQNPGGLRQALQALL